MSTTFHCHHIVGEAVRPVSDIYTIIGKLGGTFGTQQNKQNNLAGKKKIGLQL